MAREIGKMTTKPSHDQTLGQIFGQISSPRNLAKANMFWAGRSIKEQRRLYRETRAEFGKEKISHETL